jgi:hypothetical protein
MQQKQLIAKNIQLQESEELHHLILSSISDDQVLMSINNSSKSEDEVHHD